LTAFSGSRPAAAQVSTLPVPIPDWEKEPTTLVFPAFLHTLGIRKATETQLRIYTKNRVRVKDPQGLAVTRLKSWDDPKSKKDDDEVTGYGVNSGYNMVIYNTSMTSLGIYGMNEKGRERLNKPMGITANSLGDVYVADTGNDRIVRLFNPKKQLRFVTAIGGRGSKPGQFLEPHDVALDSKGFLYVADTGNHRIQVFDAENNLVRVFGEPGKGEGELWRPTAIAVTDANDPWSYYRDEFVVIVDLNRKRLQKFWPDGSFARAVLASEFGADDASLAYIAIDYYSNIWVTDQANHAIHKFDRNLNHLATFGRYGTGDKEFVEPRGISIYKRFGQVFVAERNTAQYYWIGTDVRQVRAAVDSATGAISLTYFLTEPSYVTLNLEDPDGRKVTVLKSVWRPSGSSTDLIDGAGRPLPRNPRLSGGSLGSSLLQVEPLKPGEYKLSLRIEPTYSSYRYFHKDVPLTVIVP
jgi:DNA-binding beta-propeller fold protein YncE